jgi:periplasmic protein CpxP/Spy
MKKLCIIAIAFITLQATAQDQKPALTKSKVERVKSDMTPEEIAQIQTKKMTLELDLNESQQKQVNALLLEEARNRAEKKEAYNKIKDNAEAKAALTKEDRVKMMNERLDNQIAMKAKMKNILNADQYAKWEQKMTQKTGKREGFKKKMQESKTSKD